MTPQQFTELCSDKAQPLIAILRGVQPEEAAEMVEGLIEAGFYFIEVPLNSPRPLESIAIMAETAGERALVGAGTCLTPDAVQSVYDAGGRMIVTPNCNPAVIEKACELGMASFPGIATPTEAFAAQAAGATALKAFPTDLVNIGVIKAMLAVLPKGTEIMPVGGINPDAEQMAEFLKAGASGFGLGSSLYKPGDSAEVVKQRAKDFISALSTAKTLI